MTPVRTRLALMVALAATPTLATAYNSEEHKLAADLGVAEVTLDPSITLPYPTRFYLWTDIQARNDDLASFQYAKSLAVGFATNDVAGYSDQTKKVQDNSYWSDLQGPFVQRGTPGEPWNLGNLYLWIPAASDADGRPLLVNRALAVVGYAHAAARTFTFGELVSLYGDYRRTTHCQGGACFLTNVDTPTIGFYQGTECFTPIVNCGWRPDPVTSEAYLRAVASGLWPPYHALANSLGNTAYDGDTFEAGWWGDEMLRIAGTNQWHFSTAALAWYVGMHRHALSYVEQALDDPDAWNVALHFEASALHSLTDLFAFGHVVTNRDETSHGIVLEENLTGALPYLWQDAVLAAGGAVMDSQPCSELSPYTCRKIVYPDGFTGLPALSPLPATNRNDLLLAYGQGAWSGWGITEHDLHGEFNEAGACVRNLNGDAFLVHGDGKLRNMLTRDTRCGATATGVSVIADTVRVSLQGLFDAHLALASGATVEELASAGSPYFAALRYIPIYVIQDLADARTGAAGGHFTGRWTRYALAADAISGAGVVADAWDGGACQMAYADGGHAPPEPGQARCRRFPVIVSPASASVAPEEARAFTARGGSDTERFPDPAGYVWSLATNASGGSIDPVSGAYQAGKKGGVTDVVRVSDLSGMTASATVEVTGEASSGGCGCASGEGGLGVLAALLASFALRARVRWRRVKAPSV